MLQRNLLNISLFFLIMISSAIAAAETPTVKFFVKEFIVEGGNPLSMEETRKILNPYMGEHEGLELIETAARTLQDVLYKKGYTFHRVIVPPQLATEGVIRLRIITYKIDQVTIEGNKYYPDDNIRASLPDLKSGWTPNTRQISRSLLMANEHPTKNLAVFIRNSDKPDSINARIETRDMRPQQFFSSFSNTGNRATGHTRLSVGYQHSNLFNRDHIMTLSYTTSPGHFSDVQQFGGFYRIPFYKIGAGLSMFATHSKVDQGTVGEFFQVSGKGTFLGAGFDYALFPIADYSHKLELGIQDRLFENDTSFVGTPIGVDIRSRPISLRYEGRWEKTKAKGDFYVEYVKNLTWGGSNNSFIYLSNRAGADCRWDAIRYGGRLDYPLPGNYLLRLRLTGQEANEPLISGEQIGLGGASSIRGFEEREVIGDSGQYINLEIWSPVLTYNTRILAFADIGRRDLDEPVPNQESKESLSSVGIGFRWQWRQNLNISCDVAYVTNGSATTDSGDGKIHFNLFYRF